MGKLKKKNNNSATKKDIKRLEKSLRGELKRGDRVLREEILRVEGRLERAEDKLLKKMDEQHDKVMTAISNFAGRVTTLEDENTLGTDHCSEFDNKVTDHEKRIALLE